MFLVKTIVTGDEHVKKALYEKMVEEKNTFNRKDTVGAEFSIISQDIEKETFNFQLWNINEKKRYEEAKKVFYLGAKCGIIFVDGLSKDLLVNINNKINEIWEKNSKGMIPVEIIVRIEEERKEKREKIEKLVEKYTKELNKETKEKEFEIGYQICSNYKELNREKLLDNLGRYYLKIIRK